MEILEIKKPFEIKEIDSETLTKVKSLPRIDFDVFTALILNGTVRQLVKFKHRKTIFFDEEIGYFLYLNPAYLELRKCGEFIE